MFNVELFPSSVFIGIFKCCAILGVVEKQLCGPLWFLKSDGKGVKVKKIPCILEEKDEKEEIMAAAIERSLELHSREMLL